MSTDPQPPDPDQTTMPPDLGEQLRAARQAKKLSIRELARTLGLSPALIGHIETGRTLPSINTLYAMATTLELSLDKLFTLEDFSDAHDRAGAATVATDGVLIGRYNARAHQVSGLGVHWESLTSTGQPLRFGILSYDAGVSTTLDGPPVGHEGTEHAYVLSGTLELVVGERKYILNSGDSFELDARIPHALSNPGTHPVHLLWAILDPHIQSGHKDE